MSSNCHLSCIVADRIVNLVHIVVTMWAQRATTATYVNPSERDSEKDREREREREREINR